MYEAFLSQYPTIQSLAEAEYRDVARALRPLGLEWRVPAFLTAAKTIVSDYAGQVPHNRQALIDLPGVGDYVADAVRCFAYGEPVALVDTNTVRVAGRYLGFLTGQESRRQLAVREAVASLLDRNNPTDSNLALLDLAAIVCTPRAPRCASCPVSSGCAWRKVNRPDLRQTAVTPALEN